MSISSSRVLFFQHTFIPFFPTETKYDWKCNEFREAQLQSFRRSIDHQYANTSLKLTDIWSTEKKKNKFPDSP